MRPGGCVTCHSWVGEAPENPETNGRGWAPAGLSCAQPVSGSQAQVGDPAPNLSVAGQLPTRTDARDIVKRTGQAVE